MTAVLAMAVMFVVFGVLGVLAQAWGVDSRDESADPHRSLYPVGIS